MELKTWEDAAACAIERGGKLVQIDNLEEQDAIYDAIINGAQIPIDYADSPDGGMIAYVWIGANDLNEEGTWIWDGDKDGAGNHFYTGTSNGEPIGNAFINWGGIADGNQNEPDNYADQDAAAIGLDDWPENSGYLGKAGEWNDIDITNEFYFIIEYGCTTGYNYQGYNVCEGDSILIAGEYYAEAFIHYDTLQTAEECDSIIITELLVDSRPENFEIDGEINAIVGEFVNYTVPVNYYLDYYWFVMNGEITDEVSNHEIEIQWQIIGEGTIKAISENSDGCLSDTAFLSVNIGTDNINESLGNKNFRICPNPASDEIRITASINSKIIVTNGVGQIVKTFKVSSQPQFLNIKDLDPGNYYISFFDENQLRTYKIIKR